MVGKRRNNFMKKNILSLFCAVMILISSIGSVDAYSKAVYNSNNVAVISNLSEANIKALLPAKMKDLAKDLYRIEHSSKPINALFLMSIVRIETGNGSSSAYRVKNNVGGVRGKCGYRSFSSRGECLRYMQDFLYRGYISTGRKSVSSIGAKYSASGRWAAMVNSFATSSYRKACSLKL